MAHTDVAELPADAQTFSERTAGIPGTRASG
ncbi:hypothetical protein SAMN04489832_3430 [Micromonospora cremea]|uniref:Uncharacterized protein n=1 Tax=Micromonospora cremea TaxID=709881 RepID=A0A1N5YYB4_9ACTN|nr:hypothetical protein SAMN04489832_3430 [Micromonospora cremea]